MTGRPPRNRLVFHALCVLDQAIRDCQHKGPLKLPQPGLRSALAYLYAVSSDQPDIHANPREVFDRFWQVVTGADIGGSLIQQARFRSTQAGTEFAGICRRIGIAQDIALGEAFAGAAGGMAGRRESMSAKDQPMRTRDEEQSNIPPPIIPIRSPSNDIQMSEKE